MYIIMMHLGFLWMGPNKYLSVFGFNQFIQMMLLALEPLLSISLFLFQAQLIFNAVDLFLEKM